MKRILSTLLAGLFAGADIPGFAGVAEIPRDTQRTTQANGDITSWWWMPQQFWEEAMKGNPALTDEGRAQVLAPLADYALFGVMRAKVGGAGISDIQPKAELLKNLKLEVNGKAVEPLAPESIAPGAQMLLGSTLKPAMTAMGGAALQGMEFVVFPAKADGKPLIDALQAGSVQLTLYDQTNRFRTPLGSLLPVKVDAKTGEEFPGNYSFNPFTGEKSTCADHWRAAVAGGVLRVSTAAVLRMSRPRAQWPCFPRRARALGDDLLRGLALLHPVHDGREHASKLSSVRSPPPQWPMPGTRNSRMPSSAGGVRGPLAVCRRS